MLYIIDPKTNKTLATWHVGEPYPTQLRARVILLQADGDEEGILLNSIRQASSTGSLPSPISSEDRWNPSQK